MISTEAVELRLNQQFAAIQLEPPKIAPFEEIQFPRDSLQLDDIFRIIEIKAARIPALYFKVWQDAMDDFDDYITTTLEPILVASSHSFDLQAA